MRDIEKDLKRLGGVGILTDKDLAELSEGVRRVYALMSDMAWHSAEDIRLAAGNGRPASEGLRRLRELRERVNIVKKRDQGRNWCYRIEIPKEVSGFVQRDLYGH